MLFALDEVANIAPLEELPQIASEGGGQGLLLLAALQDLSQARQRWGTQADGFLTLFGTKLILPGIADTRTLEKHLDDARRVRPPSHRPNRPQVGIARLAVRRQSPAATRQPISAPNAPACSRPARSRTSRPAKRLHLDGVRWELVDPHPRARARAMRRRMNWRPTARSPTRPGSCKQACTTTPRSCWVGGLSRFGRARAARVVPLRAHRVHQRRSVDVSRLHGRTTARRATPESQ